MTDGQTRRVLDASRPRRREGSYCYAGYQKDQNLHSHHAAVVLRSNRDNNVCQGGADRARAGMAGMSKIAKGRVKSQKSSCQMSELSEQIATRTVTYVQKVRDPEEIRWRAAGPWAPWPWPAHAHF